MEIFRYVLLDGIIDWFDLSFTKDEMVERIMSIEVYGNDIEEISAIMDGHIELANRYMVKNEGYDVIPRWINNKTVKVFIDINKYKECKV